VTSNWLDRGLDPKAKRKKLKAEERKRDEETAAKEAGNAVTFKAAAEAYAKVPTRAKQWTNDHYRHQWLRQLELYIFPRSGPRSCRHQQNQTARMLRAHLGVLKPFGICAVASRKYSTGARTRAGVLSARTLHRGRY
jgi:hypothetical protein